MGKRSGIETALIFLVGLSGLAILWVVLFSGWIDGATVLAWNGYRLTVLDRGGDVLRRADEFLQDTKGQVSEALRAGQEAIRPAPAARKA